MWYGSDVVRSFALLRLLPCRRGCSSLEPDRAPTPMLVLLPPSATAIAAIPPASLTAAVALRESPQRQAGRGREHGVARPRAAAWRRSVDMQYARLQLYEDRPFAYAEPELVPDTPGTIDPVSVASTSRAPRSGASSVDLSFATPISGDACMSSRWAGSDLDQNVMETQQLIKDALEERSPQKNSSAAVRNFKAQFN